MDVQVRHTPAFAVVRCTMAGGEAVRAEAGAMMATSDGVAVEAKMQGGLMKSLKRSVLGGESLFITTYTAPARGGWVDCAANLPGDALVRTVTSGRALNLSRGAFLCADALDRDVERLEDAGREPLLLAQQAEEDVLGADVVVLQDAGLLLREDDHLPGPFCEALEHLLLSSRVPRVG